MKNGFTHKLDGFFGRMPRGKLMLWTGILSAGLFAFELFNFKSTQFSLQDILADITIGPFLWATTLAFALCAVDLAGIGRIFTPETNSRKENEFVWYLFGAWLLAAGFNAMLTWWGVTGAMLLKANNSLVLAKYPALTEIVPVAIAVLVLVTRMLLINTFASASDFALHTSSPSSSYTPARHSTYTPPTQAKTTQQSAPAPAPAASTRPLYTEPTYHPVGTSAQPKTPATNTPSELDRFRTK